MSDILHHLVRRCVAMTNEHYAEVVAVDGLHKEPQVKRIASWGMILLWATTIFYMLVMSAVRYTYGDVVGTLAMIETPTAKAYTAVEDESTDVNAPLLSEDQKSEKQHIKALEADLFLVKQEPITGTLKRAAKHLHSVGGPFARFRGLHIAILHDFIYSVLVALFVPSGVNLTRSIVSVVATVALCRLRMTWTHVVISNPSQTAWYHRFPSLKEAKKIILPTAVFAIAQQAALYIPAVLFLVVRDQLVSPAAYGGNRKSIQKTALVELIIVFLIAISTLICITIPAHVTLTRVQASMLPEEHEAIVPFDRTFAGKVKPDIPGGTGCIGMLDAWRSFEKSGRIRLIKLYAKVFAIQAALAVFYVLTIIGQLRLIMGDDFNRVMKSIQDDIKGNV